MVHPMPWDILTIRYGRDIYNIKLKSMTNYYTKKYLKDTRLQPMILLEV